MITTRQEAPGAAAEGFRANLAGLRDCEKPGHGEPAYTRWVNRRIGRLFAAVAISGGVSPNSLTVLSGAFSLAAILLLAWVEPTFTWCAVIVGLLLVAYALDSSDGQVARFTKATSRAGEWLDHVMDAAKLPAFHIAIAVSLLRSPEFDDLAALVAAALALVVSVWFFAQILAGQMLMGTSAGPARRAHPGAWRSTLVSLAKAPMDLTTGYLLVLLLPWPAAFLVGYSALFALSCALAGAALIRRYRDLAEVDRASKLPT